MQEGLEDPWGCTLKFYDRQSGKARPQAIDLVETFNYLLGHRVREIKAKDGFLTDQVFHELMFADVD